MTAIDQSSFVIIILIEEPFGEFLFEECCKVLLLHNYNIYFIF